MNRQFSRLFPSSILSRTLQTDGQHRSLSILRLLLGCTATALLFSACSSHAQVITVDTSGKVAQPANSPIDRRYAQITPTHVPLAKTELDEKARLNLIRTMQSEQGFAMRPLPGGHRGLTLQANGKLEPAGEAYLNLVTSEGTSSKPGDRVVITDLKIEHSRIIFDLNDGPDKKHRFLSHIQIGAGPDMNPVVADNGMPPTGSRVTLEFKDHVPDLTGAEVKALLAPLISFDVKTPIQAFTDTLPTVLKDSILNHHVMVGMTTEMVLFAVGQPRLKTREMDGQMPFEEWIYGNPPQDVSFVRINGNRVIRLEVAKMGKPPQIFTKDEVEGLMRTDGSPLTPAAEQRTVAMGDVEKDENKQAPAAAPSLRQQGEALPADDNKTTGTMRPVQFPTDKQDEPPVAHQDKQQGAQSKDQQDAQAGGQTGTQQGTQLGANPDGEPAAQPAASTPASTQSAPPAKLVRIANPVS